jgi:hypothetical protein
MSAPLLLLVAAVGVPPLTSRQTKMDDDELLSFLRNWKP